MREARFIVYFLLTSVRGAAITTWGATNRDDDGLPWMKRRTGKLFEQLSILRHGDKHRPKCSLTLRRQLRLVLFAQRKRHNHRSIVAVFAIHFVSRLPAKQQHQHVKRYQQSEKDSQQTLHVILAISLDLVRLFALNDQFADFVSTSTTLQANRSARQLAGLLEPIDSVDRIGFKRPLTSQQPQLTELRNLQLTAAFAAHRIASLTSCHLQGSTTVTGEFVSHERLERQSGAFECKRSMVEK